MPIGPNKLMQMGGGGGDSTPYIAASGGSLSTGSHSDADNIPLTLHSWQSSGTSTFSINVYQGQEKVSSMYGHGVVQEEMVDKVEQAVGLVDSHLEVFK